MNSDKPIRVAIASDQVVYRRGLASLVMSLSNIQLVGEAENGIEAVQLSALVMPEIVLLDVRGTIESRKELAKEIRKRSPQVKVVVMFDSHEEKLVPPDSDGEENIYFSKDITEEEFIEGIQAIHQDNAPAKREKPPQQEAPLEESMGIDPSKLP
ncbi:MAG: DNA-binding response regulator, partial [Chloroflexota bacterium]